MTTPIEVPIPVGNIPNGSTRPTSTEPTDHRARAYTSLAIIEDDLYPLDNVALYFREAASAPLLDAEQEVQLAQTIEKGTVAYFLALANAPDEQRETPEAQRALQHPRLNQLLAHWEENLKDTSYEELLSLVREGIDSRTIFVQSNTRLVINIAKKYRGQGVPFLDLIQEGNMILMRAIGKYDWRFGHRFSTYATWWINESIKRALASQGRTIHIPIRLNDTIRKMHSIGDRIERETGREARPEELAYELRISLNKVLLLQEKSQSLLSLERTVGTERDSEFQDFIADESWEDDVDGTAIHNLIRADIDLALHNLSQREREILELRFGLIDGHSYTLKEVSKMFGITRERVRQIQEAALERIRNNVASEKLREYHEG